MHYVAMQVLTWGTIAGAIGSALLLAALDNPLASLPVDLPVASTLPSEPTQAGRTRIDTAVVAPAATASQPGR